MYFLSFLNSFSIGCTGSRSNILRKQYLSVILECKSEEHVPTDHFYAAIGILDSYLLSSKYDPTIPYKTVCLAILGYVLKMKGTVSEFCRFFKRTDDQDIKRYGICMDHIKSSLNFELYHETAYDLIVEFSTIFSYSEVLLPAEYVLNQYLEEYVRISSYPKKKFAHALLLGLLKELDYPFSAEVSTFVYAHYDIETLEIFAREIMVAK